ncbi:uncharacterized protein LOC121064915 isoform X2 [Cygnus olor]|uniref:uncharacterized protein LOC121064915 isoform X2 n=1 Tax=Cygnus olor TaxID=8869 RepID=UPI001ADE5A64|nr:uncharacterized protein LOC121064915 isoform X2 [Cygnus olor]
MPCKTFCACLHRLCPQLCSAFWRAEGVGRIQRKGERCQGAQRAAPSCWDAGSMIRRESGRGDDMGEGGVRKSFILDRSHSLSSREICRSGESGGWFLWKVSLDCEKEKGGACAGRSGPARASWEMRRNEEGKITKVSTSLQAASWAPHGEENCVFLRKSHFSRRLPSTTGQSTV